MLQLYNSRSKTMEATDTIERRLFIVVGGGLNWNKKKRLESDIISTLDWCGFQCPAMKKIQYLFIVKSMADTAAMVRQYVRGKDDEPAFHTSAAVIVIKNETLELVNHRWATVNYTTLQDHLPYPVIFPEGAMTISINFDAYPGEGHTPDYAWQDLFPGWKSIGDVNSEAWLSALAGNGNVSVHRITKVGTGLGFALMDATNNH